MRGRADLDQGTSSDEAGFTLIELITVAIILPLVLGGVAAAFITIIGLQNGVQARTSDSNDALIGSANFNKDVQSAQQIETATVPGCGASSQTQVLGLQWGQDANGTYQTVVSYVVLPVARGAKTTYSLARQLCTAGASSVPSSWFVVARDVNASPTVTFNPTGFLGTNAPWKSTQGLFGVTIAVTAPGSGYSYSLSGLPGASASTGSVSQIVQAPNPAGCNLASPGSGTYANVLCFADLTGYNPNLTSGCQQYKLSIADSPDFLRFCLSVSTPNDVRPQALPTYYGVGTGPGHWNSEAYLGNNGFYTGVAGLPALSMRSQPNGCTTSCTFNGAPNGAWDSISLSNIEVTNAVGQPASGWTFVTGDAESTDTNGWLEFQNSSVQWNILPNSATSLWGNACFNGANPPSNRGVFSWTGPVPPSTTDVGTPSGGPPSTANATLLPIPTGPTYATGTNGILCEENIQLNHTGALMLASPEPTGSSAPQNVTIAMKGEGWQAFFLGVLL